MVYFPVMAVTRLDGANSATDIRLELFFHLVVIVAIVILWSLFQWYRRTTIVTIDTVTRAASHRDKSALTQLRELFTIVAITVALMHAAVPTRMRWSEFHIFAIFRWAAVVTASMALAVFAWAVYILSRVTSQKGSLVVAGPYAHVRHPMYLAVATALCSISIVAANWVLLLMSAAFLFVLWRRILPREEARLASRFESKYAAYASATPRFIPRRRRS